MKVHHVRSLIHDSPLDKNKHATVSVLDESGDELGKFHVTDDPALQEVSLPTLDKLLY